jgi:putative chitinase
MTDLVSQVSAAMLLAVGGPGPSGRKARRDLILSRTAIVLPDLMRQFEITSRLRIAHFRAQIAHESDGFHTTEEYASGAAYEGREDLGNVKPGDGIRYKGRGEIQVTGRENHRKFTMWMRGIDPSCPDFEAEPERLEEFPWAVWSAIWYWSTRRLNVVADRDDLLSITRSINGGKNGLADRGEKLGRAKAWLDRIEAEEISAAQDGFRVLYRGVEGQEEEVARLQVLLAEAGYYHGPLDGLFGSGTDNAVRTFQKRLKLKIDGKVGTKTWGALVTLMGVTE